MARPAFSDRGRRRPVLKKLGIASPDNTDHELHGAAVSLAGRHDKAAKLLNKALDERHRLAINQFAKATTDEAVRSLWRDAVRRGEISGAYWAALTHPAASRTVIRHAFGEVHMLSHLYQPPCGFGSLAALPSGGEAVHSAALRQRHLPTRRPATPEGGGSDGCCRLIRRRPSRPMP